MPKTGLFLEDDLADFRKLLFVMSGNPTKIPATCSNSVYSLRRETAGAHNRLRWSAAGRTDQARSGMERNYVSG
jgi:hypothetical protein